MYMCKGKQAKLTEFDHNRLRSTECLSETEHKTPNTGVSYTYVRNHIQSSEQFTLERNENFQTSVCQNVSKLRV